MRVVSAMLCNSAEVRETLLYVLGGGPEWFELAEVPGALNFALAVTLEHGRDDREAEIGISVAPADEEMPDADLVAVTTPLSRGGQWMAGAPLLANRVVGFGAEVDRVGGWVVRVRCDGTSVDVPFGVRLAEG